MSKWLNSYRNYFLSKYSTPNAIVIVSHFPFCTSRYVLVSPKERKVVIVESVLCPTEIRETLARVLFRHFEVSYSLAYQ